MYSTLPYTIYACQSIVLLLYVIGLQLFQNYEYTYVALIHSLHPVCTQFPTIIQVRHNTHYDTYIYIPLTVALLLVSTQ